MTKDKYEAMVVERQLHFMGEEEAKLRAQADIYEASVERQTKMLDMFAKTPAEKLKVENEITQMLDQIRALRDEAALVEKRSKRLATPEKPKLILPTYNLNDVIFTFETDATKDAPALREDPRFTLAMKLLRAGDKDSLVAARDILKSIAWAAPGDSLAMAALLVLDKIIAAEAATPTLGV